jgi:dynein heavy chain
MTKEIKDNIAHMCVHVHESVSVFTDKFFQLMRRRVYTTPKSYLDLVECYKTLLIKKRDQLTNNRQKLSNGLSKLAEANSTISDLKIKLVDLQPVLV